jgi:hypothetical protein
MRGIKQQWADVTAYEVYNFTVFTIFVGLVEYPKISAYWSRYFPYPNTFVSAVMT